MASSGRILPLVLTSILLISVSWRTCNGDVSKHVGVSRRSENGQKAGASPYEGRKIDRLWSFSSKNSAGFTSDKLDSLRFSSGGVDFPGLTSAEIDSLRLSSVGLNSPGLFSDKIDLPSLPTDKVEYRRLIKSGKIDSLRIASVVDNYPGLSSDKVGSPSITSGTVESQRLTKSAKVELARVTSTFGNAAKKSDEFVLAELLLSLVSRELAECDLVICYGSDQSASTLPEILSTLLPNAKQVLQITRLEDFSSILWTSAKCRGYLFLSLEPKTLLDFANSQVDAWDYLGRYIFADIAMDDLELLVSSAKGKKTENIVGVIKTRFQGVWSIYMNLLYWGEGVQRTNTWKNGRFVSEAEIFPDKLEDLRGAQLVATTFVWEPDVLYYKDEDGKVIFHYGTDVEVVTSISKKLNFTIFYQEPPNGEMWGDVDANGSWAGMMGILQRDETDMAFSLYVSEYFLDILDYTIPYKFEMSCFVVPIEPPLPKWPAIFYPFHLWTWFSLLVMFLITGTILFFFSQGSRHFGGDIRIIRSLAGSFQYAFAMHLNKSLALVPRRPTTQIYILFLWLYCMIVAIAYSSNLTAFLTVKELPKVMETIKDLREAKQVPVGIDNFYKDMFQSSPDENLHDLAQTYVVIENQEKIFNLLRSGKGYVYQGNEGYLQFAIATKFTKKSGEPQLRVMKECFASHSLALGLKNHSPLKRSFNKVLDGMISGGLVTRYFKRTLSFASTTKEYGFRETDVATEDVEEVGVSENKVMPLGIDHLQGIFLIAAAGWALSLLVFAIEVSLGNGCGK